MFYGACTVCGCGMQVACIAKFRPIVFHSWNGNMQGINGVPFEV